MSGEKPVVIREFRVGRFTCTMSIPRLRKGRAVSATVEWEPRVPLPIELSSTDLATYRKHRDAAYAEAAKICGLEGGIMVVEPYL